MAIIKKQAVEVLELQTANSDLFHAVLQLNCKDNSFSDNPTLLMKGGE
ncbi:MAG TPA: hypothetical protein VIK55_14140 [Paludibacter sp.]